MTPTERPITVEDLRRKAMRVRDIADSEVRHLRDERATQVVVAGVAVVVAAVALAYYLGSRRRYV
ncbi:MAG: hypothetical protein Q8S43_02810 [Actinomycetota bacterium]|nr:MAG: hypothetical protein FD171_1317 [Actinomycetota bacterium]MDO8949388.1 hypothetical protein [Actinomycetota bacterium]MDP3629872.1 hypothetical protein [Actinomycetota bacterium]